MCNFKPFLCVYNIEGEKAVTIDEIYQMYMNDVYRFLLSMTKTSILLKTYCRKPLCGHTYTFTPMITAK